MADLHEAYVAGGTILGSSSALEKIGHQAPLLRRKMLKMGWFGMVRGHPRSQTQKNATYTVIDIKEEIKRK